jgi:hypothetical protein
MHYQAQKTATSDLGEGREAKLPRLNDDAVGQQRTCVATAASTVAPVIPTVKIQLRSFQTTSSTARPIARILRSEYCVPARTLTAGPSRARGPAGQVPAPLAEWTEFLLNMGVTFSDVARSLISFSEVAFAVKSLNSRRKSKSLV